MKHYAFLLLSLLAMCLSCEPYGLMEPLDLTKDSFTLKAKFSDGTNSSIKAGKTVAEPVVCDLGECRIETNNLTECLECVDLDSRNVEIRSYMTNRPRGCDDPKELFTCIPPVPLHDLIILVDYDDERMVSGKITDTRGNVYAQTTRSLISFEDGKAHLQFLEVNPELRERFLKLSITTAVEVRGKLSTITLNGDLGEGGIRE